MLACSRPGHLWRRRQGAAHDHDADSGSPRQAMISTHSLMDSRAQLDAVLLLPCFPLWGPFENARWALLGLPWCPSGNALNGRQGTVGRSVPPSLLPSVGSI